LRNLHKGSVCQTLSNALEISQNINIKLFANDTSLYVIVDEQNYIQAADMLSTDLSHIHSWSQNWAIKFNPNKTESVLFTRRNIKDVSLAKSLILQSRSSTISSMYIRNRKGPNTDPWGTPASIPSHPDENPSKTTFCFLSSK
jgi:hypothetical protein